MLLDKFFWSSNSYSALSFTKVNQPDPPCAVDMGCESGCFGDPTPAAGVACEVVRNRLFTNAFSGSDCGTNQASLDKGVCKQFSYASMLTPTSSGLFSPLALEALANSGIGAAIGDNSCQAVSHVCDGSLQASNPFHGITTSAAEHGVQGMLIVPRYPTNMYSACTRATQVPIRPHELPLTTCVLSVYMFFFRSFYDCDNVERNLDEFQYRHLGSIKSEYTFAQVLDDDAEFAASQVRRCALPPPRPSPPTLKQNHSADTPYHAQHPPPLPTDLVLASRSLHVPSSQPGAVP